MIKPNSPFEHQCSNGIYVKAARCDLRGGVEMLVRDDATDSQIAAGAAQAFGYHAAVILPALPSFGGYDAVTITIVRA